MKLLIIGIQGSGKGTQSQLISKKFKLKHISTGDLIREEISKKSKLGNQIKEYSEKGLLVPEEIINKLAKKNLPKNNFLLDGYPRNLNQVKFLDSITKIDKVIDLKLSEKEVLNRLSNRFQCPKCKTQYGLNQLPKKKGICDKCKEELIQRNDDKPASIKKRIKIFKKETLPILKHYKEKVISINGNQSVEKVFEKIQEELGECRRFWKRRSERLNNCRHISTISSKGNIGDYKDCE
jgi:adenylate kinase